METIKFKTTIKCSNCVAKVTPVLDQIEPIKKWEVDLDSPDRVLTVEAEGLNDQMVTEKLAEIGYIARKL